MRSTLWAFGAVLALAPSAASADCALVGLTPKVVNAGVTLPADGAFVVVADPLVDGPLAKGDITIHSDWRVRTDTRAAAAPKIETVAPGLSLYRVDGTPGTAQLEDGAKKSLATSKVIAGMRTPFPAPVVKKLTYELQRGMHRSESVTAELDGAIPGGAIAIVMTDAKGSPRSFGIVTAGKPVLPYHSFDCTPLPNGTKPSKTGDKVTLRWVDEAGRLSPASRPITID